MDSTNKKVLYELMVSEKDKYSTDADYMWKLAKAAYEYAMIVRNENGFDEAKKLFFEASDYGEAAVDIDIKNAEAHKWYSIALGAVRDYNSIEKKIFNGHMIKMHCDQAMESMPLDPILIHLQGRWRYEISMFTFEENNLAARMFCIPPYSTFEEAESLLLKAQELRPDWKENLLYLGKTYIAKGELDKAMEIIARGVELPSVNEHDILPHKELLSLHKDLFQSKE